MVNILMLISVGVFAGVCSGFLGIGGATVVVPALVFIWGLTQHQAQGTTLAMMVPPIGILAALRYYQSGNVNIKFALFICLGFFVGALIGAIFVQPIPDPLLKKAFGFFLFIVALRMIFS